MVDRLEVLLYMVHSLKLGSKLRKLKVKTIQIIAESMFIKGLHVYIMSGLNFDFDLIQIEPHVNITCITKTSNTHRKHVSLYNKFQQYLMDYS